MSRNLRIILASGSPRRRALLSRIIDEFDVIVSEAEEMDPEGVLPHDLVLRNARLKAMRVAREEPEALVLGSDTTVAYAGEIFNKPKSLPEAHVMLEKLSGKTHHVYTGVALVSLNRGVDVVFHERAAVTFKHLDAELIHAYHEKVDPLDRAGAYSVQDYPEMIIEGFDGAEDTIAGLPVEMTRLALDAQMS